MSDMPTLEHVMECAEKPEWCGSKHAHVLRDGVKDLQAWKEKAEARLKEFEDRESKGRAEFRQLWGNEDDNLLTVARKLATWRDYVNRAEDIAIYMMENLCTRMKAETVKSIRERLDRFTMEEVAPTDSAREAELEATVMHLHDFIVDGYGFGHVIKYRARSAERWFDDPNMNVREELLYIASYCEKRHEKTTAALEREHAIIEAAQNKWMWQGMYRLLSELRKMSMCTDKGLMSNWQGKQILEKFFEDEMRKLDPEKKP